MSPKRNCDIMVGGRLDVILANLGCLGVVRACRIWGEPRESPRSTRMSQSLRGTCDIDGQWTAGCDFGESVVSGVGLGLPNVRDPRSTRISNSIKRNCDIQVSGRLEGTLQLECLGVVRACRMWGAPRKPQNEPFSKKKL